MQVLEKSDVRHATAEDVSVYIEKVMCELLYPFFLRKKVHQAIYEFLCDEFGLEEAFSEMPADQLSFQIGAPKDVAQTFAVTCRYVWLRGKMPTWKKGIIVAVVGVLIAVAALFAGHVFGQFDYDHGDLAEGLAVTDSCNPFDDFPPNF